MKKLFITGADTSLGGALADEAIRMGFSVHVFTHPSSGNSRTGKAGRHYQVHNFNPDDIFALTDLWQDMDAVIHSDIYRHFDPYVVKKVYRHNVNRTSLYIDSALEAAVSKFVFISSASIFRKEKEDGIPIDETTELTKMSGAGMSNAILRAELEVWRGSAEGLNVTVLNPGLMLERNKRQEGTPALIRYLRDRPGYDFPGRNAFVCIEDVVRFALEALDHRHDGERYIISEGNYNFRDVSRILYPKGWDGKKTSFTLPRTVKALKWLEHKFTSRRDSLSYPAYKKLFEKYSFDNTRSKESFQTGYSRIKSTLEDYLN